MAEPISSFSGISSGLDFRSLVDQIMVLERRPVDRMQKVVDTNTKRGEALGKFRDALTALQTAGKALQSGTGFDGFSTSASGQDSSGRVLVSAAAAAGASTGSYQIEVQSLAKAQKTTAGVGQASATDALNLAGGFDIKRPDGTVAASVAVAAGDSLTAIRDKINALNTGKTPSGVQATILAAGSADQRLVLTSGKAGTANAFTLADTGGGVLASLGLDAAGATPPLVKAADDARFVVDGVPMTRSTNSVADAIPGVTLTLNSAEAGRTGTVNVERLASAGSDAAKAFVDAYNQIVAFVKAQNVAPAADGTAPPLRNDPLLRGTQLGMAAKLLEPVAGADAAGKLATLGAVGISLQRDGTLALDADKFKTAAAGRFDELKALLADRIAAVTEPVEPLTRTAGLIDERTTSMGAASGRLTSRIADMEGRMEKKRASLLAQYSKFESTIGRLKSIGDAMTAQFAGLNKKSD